MPPGEEDEEDLSQDVRGRNVEVVFQSWNGYVAIQLPSHVRKNSIVCKNEKQKHTLCSMYS